MFLCIFQVKSIKDWILKATAAHKESFGKAGTVRYNLNGSMPNALFAAQMNLNVRYDSSRLELTVFEPTMLGFRPHILALSGASGAGKSTTVELLCKELSIPIKLWTEDSWDQGLTSNFKSSSSSYSIR